MRVSCMWRLYEGPLYVNAQYLDASMRVSCMWRLYEDPLHVNAQYLDARMRVPCMRVRVPAYAVLRDPRVAAFCHA
jgi:hypothetical protein